jgi:hypothetical protein
MIERPEQRLSTADMAATAGRQSGETPPASPSVTSAPAQGKNPVAALFSTDETQRFRDRWDDAQTGFVDEPRSAVEQADELVAAVMQRLAEIFAGERSKLEGQWSRGSDVSTEELRLALRRYRSFFDRLLTYGGQAAESPAGARGLTQPPDRAPVPTGTQAVGPQARQEEPRPTATERPATGRWEDEMPRYRASWEQHFGSRGEHWETDEPCYRYAWEMRQHPQYHDRPWAAAEPELRQDWERQHPDTAWDRVVDKLRDAWESMTPAPTR